MNGIPGVAELARVPLLALSEVWRLPLRGAMLPFRVAELARVPLLALLMVGLLIGASSSKAEDKPAAKEFNHQIVGLFCPEREQDLRDLFARLPKYKLVKIDYPNAEVTIEYDPAKLWPGEKPEKYVERLDNELRNASRGTFGAKPLRTRPMDKLKWLEIPVEGLDCLGCSYAAYRMVYQLPGVEMATASFRTGKVRALVDPEKIERGKLEAALKQGGVDISSPAK